MHIPTCEIGMLILIVLACMLHVRYHYDVCICEKCRHYVNVLQLCVTIDASNNVPCRRYMHIQWYLCCMYVACTCKYVHVCCLYECTTCWKCGTHNHNQAYLSLFVCIVCICAVCARSMYSISLHLFFVC